MRNTLNRCDTDDIAEPVDMDQHHMLDLGKTVKAERTEENGTLKLGLH